MSLKGKVALVTGASRGIGRGIALSLGEAGATVFVTGRSVEGGHVTVTYNEKGEAFPRSKPETVQETAEMVSGRGGTGIAVALDHTDDEAVEALFTTIQKDAGRLDILVNNVWGGYEQMEKYNAPLWEQPVWRWDVMFDTGVRAHFTASRLAVPMMLRQGQGLVVHTTYAMLHPQGLFSGKYYAYGERPTNIPTLSKHAVNGLVNAFAHDLRDHNVCVVGISPCGIAGYVWAGDDLRRVYGALERDGDLERLLEKEPGYRGGESPEYSGRAVVALATDPDVMRKTGLVLRVADLAREYGFTDIDGRTPSGYGMMEHRRRPDC